MGTTENGLDVIDPDRNFFSNIVSDVYCRYYSLTEFFSLKLDDDNFTILNYNIRSFHANNTVFQSMLNSLDHNFKILVVSETWNNDNNIALCNLDNFNGFHTFRQNSRGGGISIFCDQVISVSKCENMSSCTNYLESCVVKFNFNNSSFIIISIYRPPSGNMHNFTIELEFFFERN